MLRWLRTTMISLRPSVTSGSRFIRAVSRPARHAAAPSISAADAPLVTMPASAPVARAITRQAPACSDSMSTHSLDAACIAASTSGCIRPPDKRVTVPAALMSVGTPKRA